MANLFRSCRYLITRRKGRFQPGTACLNQLERPCTIKPGQKQTANLTDKPGHRQVSCSPEPARKLPPAPYRPFSGYADTVTRPATARIALNRPLRRLFDYRVPDGLELAPGQRVKVPFGRQTLRSEEHTSELQSRPHLVCRLLLEKKNRRH